MVKTEVYEAISLKEGVSMLSFPKNNSVMMIRGGPVAFMLPSGDRGMCAHLDNRIFTEFFRILVTKNMLIFPETELFLRTE